MEPTIDAYPQFVANQVLKKDHLNELFGYLDEQNRLTRTNLIGIGIVCGLDVIPDAGANKITVTQGCGITSAGYLIAVNTADLTRYQDYVVPAEIIYPPLYDSATKQNKYTLWEMLPTGGTHALDATFWADKVVLMLVELKAENLKNCSPNSCDDRGTEVTVTFRYLLISLTDADKLRAELLGATGSPTTTDLDQLQQAKALLKDIRLPRFDVPRQLPLIFSAEEIFAAYRKTLTKAIIETLKSQLTQAYTIYQSILGSLPDTALQNFGSTYTYISDQLALTNPLQYQYYYDFISDLIEAYNELRAAGLYATGICCPSEDLFPRHLMLGKAIENTIQVSSLYRHEFLPSPLLGSRQEVAGHLRQLFGRIIRLIETFAVPAPQSMADFNAVRITPSYLGRELLSQKAVPFYYQITNGTPPLYELWNYAKTQENKAKTNLTYHADLYPAPVENFVLNPLEYDLEPYNFFRIEGHVGLHWFYALIRLMNLRTVNRLPFDVVVLKTGRNYNNILDWHTHQCYFQDLEALYASLKEELICLLCQEARYFYEVPYIKGDSDQRFPTKVAFMRHCDANFTYRPNTWGFLYETAFERIELFKLFTKWQRLAADQQVKDFLLLIHKIIELGDLLTEAEDLVHFNFDLYRAKHQDLKDYAALRLDDLKKMLPQESSDQLAVAWLVEDLIDHLDFIIRTCKIESFQSLVETCLKRREAIQQQLLFGNYIQKNAGINHKAGVPVGGTFLLVYTGEEEEARPPRKGRFVLAGRVLEVSGAPVPGVSIVVKNSSQATTTNAAGRFQLLVLHLPVTLVVAFVGVPTREIVVNESTDTLDIILTAEPTTANGKTQLPHGVVIADFYLPYICCSDCIPIQLNIPEPNTEEPAELVVQTGEPVCGAHNESFTVLITISGGTPPYIVNNAAVNGADGKTHTVTLPNNTGEAFIVGDQGTQKKTVAVAAHDCRPPEEPTELQVTLGNPECDEVRKNFSVLLTISGGTPPYAVNNQPVNGADGTTHSVSFTTGQGGAVEVKDSGVQQKSVAIPAHTCPPVEEDCRRIKPCNGMAKLCWYPLWLPKPSKGRKLNFGGDVQGNILINDPVRNKSFSITPEEFPVFYRELLSTVTDRDYDQKFRKFAETLNIKIAEQLGDPESCKVHFDAKNRLIGFEYYECFDFTFDIVQLTLISEEDPYNVIVHYDQNAWRLSDGISEIQGNPLGFVALDKCANTSENLCKKELNPDKVKITLQRANFPIHYEATGEEIENFFWIFERGTPKFSNIPKGEIEDPKMLENRVWLLGVTENCFITKEETLQ